MKAKEIMAKNVVTVGPRATIAEIAKVLVEHKVSGVPVVDKAGKLIGIVSEGDLLHKEVTPRLPDAINILGAIIYYNGVERFNEDFKKLMAGTAREIMTRDVITATEDVEINEIGELMLKHSIKRIPIVRDDTLVGIISRADMIKTLIQ